MPIIAVSPAESAGFNESRQSSARNQAATFSTISARIGQTLVHVTLRQTNAVLSVRFTLFSIQLVRMFVMGAAAAALLIH
jgi:hypothetical protein